MSPHVYGVFLRPDVPTSVAISTITFHVARQFGLVSAGAFPPHATLAGSVPMSADPDDVVQMLDPVMKDRAAFDVHNLGIVKHSTAITYDLDLLPDGSKNVALRDLAVAINEALAPATVDLDAYLVGAFRADRFRAHMSLASHELNVRPDLSPEVEEFIRALPCAPSPRFVASQVTLYRFFSDDWGGQWWKDLAWEPVHTWNLQELQPSERDEARS